MPAPSQAIAQDNFTRADSANLGSNWTANSDAITTGALGITSNAAKPQSTGQNAASFWNANSFTPNQYSQCAVSGSATGTNQHQGGPTVRASAGGYYRLLWNLLNGAGDISIAKVVNGVQTILTTVTSALSLGALLRLEVFGTKLSAYVNGTLVKQASDAALSSGAPGVAGFMAATSPTAFMNSWEGGNVLGAADRDFKFTYTF
jgi:hypothetical protein